MSEVSKQVRWHILNVGHAAIDRGNPPDIRVDTDDLEPAAGEHCGKRQANVSKANDGNCRFSLSDSVQKFGER